MTSAGNRLAAIPCSSRACARERRPRQTVTRQAWRRPRQTELDRAKQTLTWPIETWTASGSAKTTFWSTSLMSAPGQRGRRWGGIWPQLHWQRGASLPFWSCADTRGTGLRRAAGAGPPSMPVRKRSSLNTPWSMATSSSLLSSPLNRRRMRIVRAMLHQSTSTGHCGKIGRKRTYEFSELQMATAAACRRHSGPEAARHALC
jgi:hypothetical protein